MDKFNINSFMEWLKDEFPNCLETHWNFDLVENIIQYGLQHCNVSKDQFVNWIADLLPEVEFLEVARFMEDDYLTQSTLKELGRI